MVERIAIIGTGLIGTSLGLALKGAGVKGEIVGLDAERGVAAVAQKRGAIDKVSRNFRDAVEEAALVIIATPVMAIREVLNLIGPYLPGGCVVTDTGSTKGAVMAWANQLLADRVSFVGGHPMAGKETPGPEAADGTLFQGRTYCVIPGRGAREEAVRTVVDMVKAIGARPYFIDAVEHDSFVAAVSHLPLLLSVALVGCTSKSPSWEDIAQVAATGYRDITRLASGDPIMHRDICLTNAEGIVHWIDAFIKELYDMRKIIQQGEDSDALGRLFIEAREAREKWLAGQVVPGSRLVTPTEYGTFGERLGEIFLGRKLMEAQKRLMGDAEKKGKEKR